MKISNTHTGPSQPALNFLLGGFLLFIAWLVILLVVIALFVAFYLGNELHVVQSSAHAAKLGEPDLRADEKELKQTLVIPTLDFPITKGTNLVWCATFQIAWNKLCDLPGQPIPFESSNPVAQQLNKRSLTSADLDDSTYVAVAGSIADGIVDTIYDELEIKFDGAATPELAPPPGTQSNDWLAAYAYLFVNLPFEWAFERFESPLTFGGAEVQCFGIDRYLKSQRSEDLAAQQIAIFDARGGDDFIVELETQQAGHHLYLAKVPPQATLGATVEAVQQRIATTTPESLTQKHNFMVPLLNFDILRNYNELTGKQPRGGELVIARQQIRFQLDERGAVLKSESYMMSLGRAKKDLSPIFNKPFLIMLNYEDAENPYFAMWIDNPEVLVKF